MTAPEDFEWRRNAAEALRLILDDDEDDRAIVLLQRMSVPQLRDVALAARILVSIATGRANADARSVPEPIEPTKQVTENGAASHSTLPGSVPPVIQ